MGAGQVSSAHAYLLLPAEKLREGTGERSGGRLGAESWARRQRRIWRTFLGKLLKTPRILKHSVFAYSKN